MGKNYSGPLGFTSGTGISNRVYEASCPASSTQDPITDSDFGNSVESGSSRVIEQGGSSPGKTTSCDRGLHKFIVCSAKKGWRESPCSESEAIKSIHNIRTLQNGEGIHMLRDLLKLGDWFVKIDLKDAYLTVPIWINHQKYLCFLWKGSMLEFACLPFGLASAPRMFTKLMKPVVALLKQQGIRLIIYLDDILIMAKSSDLVLHQAASTLNLLGLVKIELLILDLKMTVFLIRCFCHLFVLKNLFVPHLWQGGLKVFYLCRVLTRLFFLHIRYEGRLHLPHYFKEFRFQRYCLWQIGLRKVLFVSFITNRGLIQHLVMRFFPVAQYDGL